MTWYIWKWRRLAYSRNRGGVIQDGAGEWQHIVLGVWILAQAAQ